MQSGVACRASCWPGESQGTGLSAQRRADHQVPYEPSQAPGRCVVPLGPWEGPKRLGRGVYVGPTRPLIRLLFVPISRPGQASERGGGPAESGVGDEDARASQSVSRQPTLVADDVLRAEVQELVSAAALLVRVVMPREETPPVGQAAVTPGASEAPIRATTTPPRLTVSAEKAGGRSPPVPSLRLAALSPMIGEQSALTRTVGAANIHQRSPPAVLPPLQAPTTKEAGVLHLASPPPLHCNSRWVTQVLMTPSRSSPGGRRTIQSVAT